MSIPSGVALLAELEGLASRDREPKKVVDPIVEKPKDELSELIWDDLAMYVFRLPCGKLFKSVLAHKGYTIIRKE